MMQHARIPPQISLHNLNPKIQTLGSDGAVFDSNGALWHQSGGGRLALINNFGAAGSNAAMILQEFRASSISNAPSPAIESTSTPATFMLGLSAKSLKALLQLRDELVDRIRTVPHSLSLLDVCYTMTARRQQYGHRISATADTLEKLAVNLKAVDPKHAPLKAKGPKSKIVFAFSGQGSQYVGMGKECMYKYPVFARTVLQCDGILRRNGFPGCIHIIDPSDNHDDGPAEVDDKLQLQSSQSAIFAVEVALARLLISWNILPSAVIGHR